ncbi:biopolymer transporter ExbD [Hydrogenimonas thermophila]|uniref:ExbD/TolR family protein n=1 Tax=Hydrogenimonas thermophila TaxID=223786 RepID=UPI0029373E38|nr:biopolymer transporter ExbD [Hydrogenimonas thermophila]WOE69464.1 biopolymer transporter ExbD [Hydrogenimonas thermophila]WOE71975.1 biopolymer transporter ExbD [Hydrogenimonas thermophila]
MKRRESLTLDMTPLVDVVFLLLIFFLVTSVFKKDELALMLNLPSSKEGSKVIDKKELIIELSKEEIAINKDILTFEEVDAKFATVKDKDRLIVVRIDKDVKYERIIKLFDLLEKYGLHNLQLVKESGN